MPRGYFFACDAPGCETHLVVESNLLPEGWIRRDVIDTIRARVKMEVHSLDGKTSSHYCPEHGRMLDDPPLHQTVLQFQRQLMIDAGLDPDALLAHEEPTDVGANEPAELAAAEQEPEEQEEPPDSTLGDDPEPEELGASRGLDDGEQELEGR